MQYNSVINQSNLLSVNYQESINSLFGRLSDYLFIKTTKSASSKISTELSKNINISTHLSYQIVHLIGEIDFHSPAKVRTTILPLLRQDSSLLIGFSNLTLIDCSVIAILVEALTVAKSTGISLSIVGAKSSPLQL